MDDLAPYGNVWMRTYAQATPLTQRRLLGGHVRLHTTNPQGCARAHCAFAQHIHLLCAAIYCRPLLMRFGTQASNCQHIKSPPRFDGDSPTLPRQSLGGVDPAQRVAAVLLLQTGAPGPNSLLIAALTFPRSFMLIFAFCFLHMILGSRYPNDDYCKHPTNI